MKSACISTQKVHAILARQQEKPFQHYAGPIGDMQLPCVLIPPSQSMSHDYGVASAYNNTPMCVH
jgi:hypothetical protein